MRDHNASSTPLYVAHNRCGALYPMPLKNASLPRFVRTLNRAYGMSAMAQYVSSQYLKAPCVSSPAIPSMAVVSEAIVCQ